MLGMDDALGNYDKYDKAYLAQLNLYDVHDTLVILTWGRSRLISMGDRGIEFDMMK